MSAAAEIGSTEPGARLLPQRVADQDTEPVPCGRCGTAPAPYGMCGPCRRTCQDYTQQLDLQRLPELNDEPLGWAAYFYARAGIPVLPLRPGEKVPATRHGVADATTDLSRVRSWWRSYPTGNIGLATGVVFDLLDIDIKGGRPGAESFNQLRRAGLTEGGWAAATTPSGGRHVLFAPSGDGNHGSGATGLDFRGRKGYMVAAPSATKAGTYQWESSDPDTRGCAFDWQAAMVHLGAAAPAQPIQHVTLSKPATPQLAGLLRRMGAAQEGERNSILHWAGCRLAESGYGPTSVDALATAAREVGLGDQEIRQTLRSAGVTA